MYLGIPHLIFSFFRSFGKGECIEEVQHSFTFVVIKHIFH